MDPRQSTDTYATIVEEDSARSSSQRTSHVPGVEMADSSIHRTDENPSQPSFHDRVLHAAASGLTGRLAEIDEIFHDVRELREQLEDAAVQTRRDRRDYERSNEQSHFQDPKPLEEQARLRQAFETSQEKEHEAEERMTCRQSELEREQRHVVHVVKEMTRWILSKEQPLILQSKSIPLPPWVPRMPLRPPPPQPAQESFDNWQGDEQPAFSPSPTHTDSRQEVGVLRSKSASKSEDNVSRSSDVTNSPVYNQAAAKRHIDSMYMALEEYRDTYHDQLDLYQKWAPADQLPEWRERFDIGFLLDIQKRTRAIIEAEEAWSEVATEARRAGHTRWGAGQTSRFSQVSDERASVFSSGENNNFGNDPWLNAWTQEQLECFQSHPPLEEDFKETWQVPAEIKDQTEPTFEKDRRLWRQPKGMRGLPLAHFDEEYLDYAQGRDRRHIDKWNLVARRAWKRTLEKERLAQPLKRSRKSLALEAHQKSKRPKSMQIEAFGWLVEDHTTEPGAKMRPPKEPSIVNVVEFRTTFQEWHTSEMVDRYRHEDDDKNEIKSLACSLEDEFGEVYWTRPRLWGKSVRRMQVAEPPKTTMASPVPRREDEILPSAPVFRRTLRSDDQNPSQGIDMYKCLAEQDLV